VRGPEIARAAQKQRIIDMSVKVAKIVVPTVLLLLLVLFLRSYLAADEIEMAGSETGSSVAKNTDKNTDKNIAAIVSEQQDLKSTLVAQKSEIDLAILNTDANKELIADLQSRIRQLEQTAGTVKIQTELPAHAVKVDTSTLFIRDESISLPDQANNPGALNRGGEGSRARRYGAADSFPDVNGNPVAIFPDRGHGLAALIDLIFAFDGFKIENYIAGGGGVEPWKSYVGGDSARSEWYLGVFEDRGVTRETVIDIKNIELVQAIVEVHYHAEGGRIPFTDDDWNQAFSLVEITRQ